MLYTIVIPCFNSSTTIISSLISITAQLSEDYEILCIDDGSTDSTIKILQDFSLINPHVRVLSNDRNMGVSYSRNLGVRCARGKYILFLDSDDIYVDGLFSKIKIIIDQYDVDIISFGYRRNGGAGKRLKNYTSHNYEGCHFSSSFLKLFLTRKVLQSVCSLVVKREILLANEIIFNQNVCLGEDIAFQIKAMLSADMIYYLPNIYFEYKYNPSSVSNSSYSYKHLSCTLNYNDVTSFLNPKDNNLYIKYINFYYQFMFFYELQYFAKVNSKSLLANYLKSDSVLNFDSAIVLNKSYIVLTLMKLFYFISRNMTVNFLKKI